MKILSASIMLLVCAFAADAQSEAGAVRARIIETAKTYLGVPYVYGAESPRAFDCSGFVRYVYRQAAAIDLPRSSKSQWTAGVPTTLQRAKPGDVVVFDTVGGAPSHVGILIDGKSFINALSTGPRTGVQISQLGAYWSPLFMGVRVYVVAGDEPAIPMQRPAAPASAPAAQQSAPAPDPAPAKPQPPAPAPAAPPRSAAPAPAPLASPAEDELAVSFVGFSITNRLERITDKIPAQVGTAIQYAVTNSTGADGVFEILFYKMDLDPSKHRTLRRDRVSIEAGSMRLVEPFAFAEPGQYRLILKTHDNLQRVERIWKVVDIKG